MKILAELFQQNVKLEKMYLFENQISSIDGNMFNHLTNLKTVDLATTMREISIQWKKIWLKIAKQIKLKELPIKYNQTLNIQLYNTYLLIKTYCLNQEIYSEAPSLKF